MFQHQPPPKVILWFELVMTSREYARQVMEIKSEWLLEGSSSLSSALRAELTLPSLFLSRAALLLAEGPRGARGSQEGAC